MSYKVEFLLNNRLEIESRNCIDDDIYCDLLETLSTIEKLYNQGKITSAEYKVLCAMQESAGKASDMSEITGMERSRATRLFVFACDKIALHLGGEYLDENFVERIAKRNRLTPEQKEKLLIEIKSRYRHSIRKGDKEIGND